MLSLAVTIRSSSGMIGPFLASVADSHGRKAGMLFGLLLFILGLGLMSVWPVYPVFVLMLVLAAMGNFTFAPSMQAYLGDKVPYQRRGLVMALTELGWSFSFIAGIPLIGWLITRFGWKAPFPFLALAGFLAFLLLLKLLPKDQGAAHASNNAVKNLKQVLLYKPALAGLLLGGGISGANEQISIIFGVWMEDRFGLKIAALAAASAIIGLSELGGETLVGSLVDRIGKKRAVGFGIIANCLAALLLPVFSQNQFGALAGLFLVYITFEFTLVSSIPLMTEVMPSSRATLMAVFVASHSLGRAIGDISALRLYGLGKIPGFPGGAAAGILAVVSVSILMNLISLAALQHVREETNRSA